VVTVLVAAVAFGAGVVTALRLRARAEAERDAARAEIERLEGQSREQARQISRLRNDQRWLSNLSRRLPDVVRDLNRSETQSRELPRLLFSLLDAIFEPERMMLYLVRAPGEGPEQPVELYLEDQRGYTEIPPHGRRIRVGDGRIGWVAQNHVEMSADAWANPARTGGRLVEDSHASLRLDMIAPILHRQDGHYRLFGVLAYGSPTIQPRDEKLMMQMVTNLASIAILNDSNLRRLREQAHHDGLTSLLNKRYFLKEKLGLAINNAERENRPLGVFIFDIDHFKHFNDTNGHVAGDQVLKEVATVLRDNLRAEDIACRYGGEEFVVAMPGADSPEAMRIAERIRVAIETHPFPSRENQPGGRVTISGGVSVFPSHGTNGTDLIHRADQALYRAKRDGRNRVLLHRDFQMGDHAPDVLGVERGSDRELP
jgi:diguanylate cyclase (GGDEF)-like protein